MFAKKKVLVADLGGTNSNFAIIDQDFCILFKKSFKTAEKKSIDDALRSFLELEETKKHSFSEACFAMAGPVSSDRMHGKFSNLDWQVNVEDIKRKFRLKRLLLINDFEAIGYSIDIMRPGQYAEITDIGRNAQGVATVIGPGTGLGVSILIQDGKSHIPIPSEGCRASLAIDASDKAELELYAFIKKKNGFVETESILSGRGMAGIYEYLMSKTPKHNKKISSEIRKANPDARTKLIVTHALQDRDALCIRAVSIFIRFYARTARNLALTTLCKELVLAGGITIGILPFLKENFVEEFAQHNLKEARTILENMIILAICEYEISLYGAANALNHFR
jgi:glucokinase